MYALNPSNAICSDICEPLINLWNVIKNDPHWFSRLLSRTMGTDARGRLPGLL